LQRASAITVLGLLLSVVLAVSAPAQQASTSAQSPTGVLTDQELAKSVHNPFEDFVKLPIQSTTGFQVGHNHNAGDSVNIEPLVLRPTRRDHRIACAGAGNLIKSRVWKKAGGSYYRKLWIDDVMKKAAYPSV
jgi:hypothetical protein